MSSRNSRSSRSGLTRLALGFAIMTLLGGWASPSVAAPITFGFTGAITTTNLDPFDPFDGSIVAGTTFDGSYTFDSTSADLAPGGLQGNYASNGPPNAFTVNIGGIIFQTLNHVAVGVFNGFDGSDGYGAIGCGEGASCPDLVIDLFLRDPTGLLFDSDALPLDAPPFAAFATTFFRLTTLVDGRQIELRGLLTSLDCREGCDPAPSPVPVPEPSSILLCMTGLGAACWRRLRTAVLAALVLFCGTSTAFAVDGVILIDQPRALAGSVTPGDARPHRHGDSQWHRHEVPERHLDRRIER
jgi:hypothetical protein